MRILQIINNFNIGGVQNFVLDLVNTAEYRKFTNLVLCIDKSDGKSSAKFRYSFSEIFTNQLIHPDKNRRPYRFWKLYRKLLDLYSGLQLLRMIEKIHPDIIHTHISAGLYWQMYAAKRLSIPIVVTIHGKILLSESEKKLIQDDSITKCITCDSKKTYEAVLGNMNNVKIIPTGIHLRNKRVCNKKRICEKYDIPHSCFLVGSVGRLKEIKGFDILMHAIQIVISDRDDIYFCVAGEGPQKTQLEKLAEDLGINSHLRMMGHYPNIDEFYSSIDCFVLPSRSEGFPLSILEAMNFEIPVIATDVGGVRDVLNNGNYGLVVPPENPEKIAEAILFMYDMPDIRKKFIDQSFRRASEYSIEKVGYEYIKVYENLLVKGNY